MSARYPSKNHPRPGSTSPPAAAPEPPAVAGPDVGLPGERLAYSVEEAARLTGLSRDLLYDEMRRGNLQYLKIGRRRLITRQHLERFLGIAPRPRPWTGGSTASDRKAAADAL